MALIKCPECGKNISDKACQCIHCGYPLEPAKQLYDIVYQGFLSDKTKYDNQVMLIQYMRQLFNLQTIREAKDIIDNPPYVLLRSTTKDRANWVAEVLRQFGCNIETVASDEMIESNTSNLDMYMQTPQCTIICPRCGSNQITTGNRGFSIITGFIGSNKTVNRCGKCGYSWKP